MINWLLVNIQSTYKNTSTSKIVRKIAKYMLDLQAAQKSPISFNFFIFIASPISSLKPPTKSITSVFKVMYQIVQNYSKNCRYFTSVNSFFALFKWRSSDKVA